MTTIHHPGHDTSRWLSSYYFLRAGVSAGWVAAAFTLGTAMPPAAAALLVAYPAWDAVANVIDARRSGGLAANSSQAVNAAASTVVAVAVAVALGRGPHAVLAVVRGLGHPLRPAATRDRRAALAGRRPMGDGAEWSAIGPRGHRLHRQGERCRDARDHGHRSLRRVRRLLLPGLGRVVDRWTGAEGSDGTDRMILRGAGRMRESASSRAGIMRSRSRDGPIRSR